MGWFERPEFGANVGLIDEIYRQYLDNPESVSPAWRDFFAENEPGDEGAEATQRTETPPTPPTPQEAPPAKEPAKVEQPAAKPQPAPAKAEEKPKAKPPPRGTARRRPNWSPSGGRRPGSWRRWRPAGRCPRRPRCGPCRHGCWRSTAASSTGTCAAARAAR